METPLTKPWAATEAAEARAKRDELSMEGTLERMCAGWLERFESGE